MLCSRLFFCAGAAAGAGAAAAAGGQSAGLRSGVSNDHLYLRRVALVANYDVGPISMHGLSVALHTQMYYPNVQSIMDGGVFPYLRCLLVERSDVVTAAFPVNAAMIAGKRTRACSRESTEL